MSGKFYDSPQQKPLCICYILSEIFKEKHPSCLIIFKTIWLGSDIIALSANEHPSFSHMIKDGVLDLEQNVIHHCLFTTAGGIRRSTTGNSQ